MPFISRVIQDYQIKRAYIDTIETLIGSNENLRLAITKSPDATFCLLWFTLQEWHIDEWWLESVSVMFGG